ncbi:bifunctional phosphopantothenoylcysteine decarboxylase/phosphopantothenate--cysteine ligase CoaBC [Hyperthermus butylicus]|uniref:bifunctional phosphopantothenoylcysteine decarboxylase/phosphopantothenate--cysteine ligase CoaBC n=1 Tax=Hyperthermus butylicus TaxID=54248 RepID=UPI00064FECFE|nr:bifunctional phosphopantothenoylcysteine decarboxylase/phosphopantothenate--cysteine ligase CoaBC [Hyperthermus butylicus]
MEAGEWLWGYHPSREIVGEYGGDLSGRCIALGVTGSVALYRSIDLARLLMRMGARVRVVMTPAAAEMVSPAVFEWATGEPVVSRLTGLVEHVTLAKVCDAVLIAPATLDIIAEIAGFRASKPVSALAQEAAGLGKPVLIVPAMHGGMWKRASKLADELEKQGFHVLRPIVEEERAKYPPVELIAWWAEAIISRGRDLEGLRFLVTAGPTREHIDPVRVITNPSTGLMGVSIALEAAFRGARVKLVHGPLSVYVPEGWRNYLEEVVGVETAEEMMESVLARVGSVDVAIYAAAVSDYQPVETSRVKIPSRKGELTLRLKPTPKIVARAVEAAPGVVHVGFAAETTSSLEELVKKAREKLEEYMLDAVAANNVLEPGAGFASETNHVIVLTWRGEKLEIPHMHKRLVARRLLDIVARLARSGARPR